MAKSILKSSQDLVDSLISKMENERKGIEAKLEEIEIRINEAKAEMAKSEDEVSFLKARRKLQEDEDLADFYSDKLSKANLFIPEDEAEKIIKNLQGYIGTQKAKTTEHIVELIKQAIMEADAYKDDVGQCLALAEKIGKKNKIGEHLLFDAGNIDSGLRRALVLVTGDIDSAQFNIHS